MENMVKTVGGRKRPMILQDAEKVAVLREIRSQNIALWSMRYTTEKERALALTQTEFKNYNDLTFTTRDSLVEQLQHDIEFTNFNINHVNEALKKSKTSEQIEDLQEALTIWEAHVQKLQKWLLRLPLTADTELSIWHAISALADVIDHHLTSSRTSSP